MSSIFGASSEAPDAAMAVWLVLDGEPRTELSLFGHIAERQFLLLLHNDREVVAEIGRGGEVTYGNGFDRNDAARCLWRVLTNPTLAANLAAYFQQISDAGFPLWPGDRRSQ